MAITLEWLHYNEQVDAIKIYRSKEKMDDSNLPEPLVTLPADVTTYTDITAIRNQLYYYKVSCVLGDDEAPCLNTALMDLPENGPGPQTLQFGDYEFGYFGQVHCNDVISYVEFKNYFGIPPIDVTPNDTYMHKLCIEGRVIFFPQFHYGRGDSFATLYSKGLLYPFNNRETYPASILALPEVEQGRVHLFGEHAYKFYAPSADEVRKYVKKLYSNANGYSEDVSFGSLATAPLYLQTRTSDESGKFWHIGTNGHFNTELTVDITNTHEWLSYWPFIEYVF